MAIATMNTYLMYKVTNAYQKLVDITAFPDLGGDPERIDVTTLSDTARVYIPGVQDTADIEFTANYTKSDYNTINGLTTEQDFGVYFGDTSGTNGAFTFKGYIKARVNGGGVNDAVTMTIIITPTTAISGAGT